MGAPFGARLEHSFADALPDLHVTWQPASVPQPRLLYLNHALATELGLDPLELDGEQGAAIFSGNAVPNGARPIAQAYAGHQFGGYSPRLGDGRALLLGELIDRHGKRRDLALKGSGRTPFSRGGDGKAAVGPMLREVLFGEALHAMGMPTTRALAVTATGEAVIRDNVLPGAVLARVAASHLRVGTFQFAAARRDIDGLRALADHAIARHDPQLAQQDEPYLALLRAVAIRQAHLIAQWMNVGFIHGVMNTDNMTISGETIDYGPCAFMEAFDPAQVFSSIDRDGRYAFGNQPAIAQWNLARLAEAMLALIDSRSEQAIDKATGVLDTFAEEYARALRGGQRAKLGLTRHDATDDADDDALAQDWLNLLHRERVDFTLGWRSLAEAAHGNEVPLRTCFSDARAPDAWLARWRARCASEDASDTRGSQGLRRAQAIRQVSPWIIPRHERVEEALSAASEQNSLEPFNRLLDALQHPFEEAPERAHYATPAPAEKTARYRTFCGT
jgi:uncharacterized protein YdiU (UPF0061 family)